MNVDFADVRAIMANAGSSLMGIGTATGMYGTCNGLHGSSLILIFYLAHIITLNPLFCLMNKYMYRDSVLLVSNYVFRRTVV